MSAYAEHGWRPEAYGIKRGGFYALVEKFWRTDGTGEDDGWRWRGFRINDIEATSTRTSDKMSLGMAQLAAEEWLDNQIESDKGLAVYRFAGMEVVHPEAGSP